MENVKLFSTCFSLTNSFFFSFGGVEIRGGGMENRFISTDPSKWPAPYDVCKYIASIEAAHLPHTPESGSDKSPGPASGVWTWCMYVVHISRVCS